MTRHLAQSLPIITHGRPVGEVPLGRSRRREVDLAVTHRGAVAEHPRASPGAVGAGALTRALAHRLTFVIIGGPGRGLLGRRVTRGRRDGGSGGRRGEGLTVAHGRAFTEEEGTGSGAIRARGLTGHLTHGLPILPKGGPGSRHCSPFF